MIRKTPGLFLSFIIFSCTSGVAVAHTGLDVSGVAAGLVHPLTGADHLLAMLAVGLWAAQNGGRKIWLLPAAFVLSLTAGADMAMIYPFLPQIEAALAASVLILGLLTALSLKLPALPSIPIIALFGFLHGYAHGLEMPAAAEAAAYAIGFLVTTITLHLIGIATGVVTRHGVAHLARVLGATIAVSGLWMAFQL